jgi:hypothetical protein
MISNAFSTSFVRGNKNIRTAIVAIGLSKFKRTHGCSCALPDVTAPRHIKSPKMAAGPEKGIRNTQEPARASAADPNPAFLRGRLTINLQTL